MLYEVVYCYSVCVEVGVIAKYIFIIYVWPMYKVLVPEIDHEIFSTIILSLSQIQEG